MKILNEQNLTEQPVIDWFKGLGYEYKFGPEISPGGVLVERDDFKKVLLEGRLKRSLRIYGNNKKLINFKKIIYD